MSFSPSLEWIAVFLAVVLLLGGLSLLALRRRNEILQDYLTPEDIGSGSQLYKKRPVHEKEKEAEPTKEGPEPSSEEAPADQVTWGTPGDGGDTP